MIHLYKLSEVNIMSYTFDGKSLKEGSKTICHVDGKYIKLGASDSKTQLAGYIMCRVEGKDIKEGSIGKTMIKISDAASVIGSKSEDNLIAAMWYLFCRPD